MSLMNFLSLIASIICLQHYASYHKNTLSNIISNK
ncbi:hypothetical protein GLYMA_12G161350v4 [Glycine max]|nr:hypothetical protein GLYMA_12G161350v4 [Glycine max]KAH1143432.1 hypothetical protein GYH30_033924 [Glycine max]